jgi:ribulose-phosphate 3-epimerase
MRNQTVKIAPSILAADFSRLGEQVVQVARGGADYIHIDVMDGHFVPNITIGAPVVASISGLTALPLDVHLMIEKPEAYVKQFSEAGASIITVHAEACTHLHRVIQMIKDLGTKVGVALNPATPLYAIEEVVSIVDLILIMTVNPGFGGQAFIEETIDKIYRTRCLMDQKRSSAELEVDGGITANTSSKVIEAGADVLVAGTAIFGSTDIGRAIQEMRLSPNERVYSGCEDSGYKR